MVKPQRDDFDDAAKNEPLCLILNEGRTFVALRPMPAFDGTFLYASRPVDPFTLEFPKQASALVSCSGLSNSIAITCQLTLRDHVRPARGHHAAVGGLARPGLHQLASSAPIRRLIAATDQVSSGNFYVQVPVRAAEGDLAHLGETFNKMTPELRLQQNRLVAANHMMDERRLFTEAVLSGVPAAVIGVGARGDVTVLNPSARDLVGARRRRGGTGGRQAGVGRLARTRRRCLQEARGGHARMTQKQMQLNRGGRERTYNVRIAPGPLNRGERTFVATLDDMTDLVAAQRTSAWADVARRIAHEIKNPLTPIQLSAERLKRKYGKVIVADKDDVLPVHRHDHPPGRRHQAHGGRVLVLLAHAQGAIVAGRSGACIEQVLFLMRVGHPDIEITGNFPRRPLMLRFDRRLLSQALTNVVKNATEGIAATEMEDRAPNHQGDLRV